MPALQDSINAVRVAAEAADRIKATDIVAFDVADLLGIIKRLIQKIQHELNLIGISPKVVGYRYLTDAILATINEPNTHIFKMLGEKYKKTDASIERAMQNAINRAWRTSDIDDLLTYYTARIHSQKGVPTIMEFIFYYANKIQNQL